MKNYAQIDSKKIVTQVLVLSDDKDLSWLESRLGGTWIESTEARKNYAGIGHTYNSELDAFIPPKPFDSWILDEETAQWEAPVEYPTDGKNYSWDEDSTSWVEVVEGE